jgi:chromosomal replication initiator protein
MPYELDASAESWDRVRGALLGQIGQDAFQNWIDPVVFIGADHGGVHLAAPTSFIGTWVSRNYGDTLRQLLC